MGAIQIKNVPTALHDRLRDRARREGRTLSDYALDVLERELSLPTTKEWLEQLSQDPSTDAPSVAIGRLLAQGRAEREERILGAVADRR